MNNIKRSKTKVLLQTYLWIAALPISQVQLQIVYKCGYHNNPGPLVLLLFDLKIEKAHGLSVQVLHDDHSAILLAVSLQPITEKSAKRQKKLSSSPKKNVDNKLLCFLQIYPDL